jgi:transcriptional regulator with GAF, ATPase, and Fis domain
VSSQPPPNILSLQEFSATPPTVVQFPHTLEDLSLIRLKLISQLGQDVKKTFLSRVNNSSAPIAFTTIPVTPHLSGFGGMEDIERALAQAGGKITRAAEILGVHRATLWRKCKRLSQAKKR